MNVAAEYLAFCTLAGRAAQAAAVVIRESSDPGRYVDGVNAGGDHVLAIDQAAERAVLEVLAADMHDAGRAYGIFSEEAGLISYGAEYPLFIIDPVDGSAQARRRHPDCAVSIAVSIGPTFADIVAGVVQPIMSGDSYFAVRGHGAWHGARALPLTAPPTGPATSVLLEGPDPVAVAAMAQRFSAAAPGCQIHISGSIALQLSLLAAGCYDAMVACRGNAHAYDIAAAWLIGKEAGIAYVDLKGLDTVTAPLTDIQILHQPASARRPDLLQTLVTIARSEEL